MAITLKEMGRGYVQTVQFRIERAEKEMQEGKQHIEELKEHLRDCENSLQFEETDNEKCSDGKECKTGTTEFPLGNNKSYE